MKTNPPTKRHTRALSGLLTILALSSLLAPAALGQDRHPTNTQPALQAQAVFQKTLGLFLSLATQDQTLCSLLAKHRVTLQYSVRDLGLECYVGFDGRKVAAAFGQCAKSDIAIVSDSATLDRVLTTGKDADALQVNVHLGVIRKLKLSKDLDAILAALSRAYAAAGVRSLAGVSPLTASIR